MICYCALRTQPWFWETKQWHLHQQTTLKWLKEIYYCTVMHDYVTVSFARTHAHTGNRLINCPVTNIERVGWTCECWQAEVTDNTLHSFTAFLVPLDILFFFSIFRPFIHLLLSSLYHSFLCHTHFIIILSRKYIIHFNCHDLFLAVPLYSIYKTLTFSSYHRLEPGLSHQALGNLME